MIKLRKKTLKNEGFSLYLDIIFNLMRIYEFLGIYLIPERTASDKMHNKEQMRLAEIIMAKRWQELLEGQYNIKGRSSLKIDFFQFAENLIKTYTVSTRGYIAVLKQLKKFWGKEVLPVAELNEKLVARFYDWLEKSLTGETPSWYIKKLKKLLKEAYQRDIISKNIALNITCRKFNSTPKDVLSNAELRLLLRTPCTNLEVKIAFLFSALTGLRLSDIRNIQANHIDGNIVRVRQQKTKQIVTIILNEDAKRLIANRLTKRKFLFNLGSHTSISKSLKAWTTKAKIEKHITYHCSRHTFSCNLLANGCDLFTTSSMLGHTTIRHTTRYLREDNHLKEQAVNKLGKIF